MKSIIEQKSDALDEFMVIVSKCDHDATPRNVEVLTKKYNEIVNQRPMSQNPHIDDVFGGRLYQWLIHWLDLKRIPQLSDCPHINYLKNQSGIGEKSLFEYRQVMTKYNFPDKLE